MSVDRYLVNAAVCVRLAERVSDSESKLALLDMADAWRRLALQADKNSHTDIVYETPPKGGRRASRRNP